MNAIAPRIITISGLESKERSLWTLSEMQNKRVSHTLRVHCDCSAILYGRFGRTMDVSTFRALFTGLPLISFLNHFRLDFGGSTFPKSTTSTRTNPVVNNPRSMPVKSIESRPMTSSARNRRQLAYSDKIGLPFLDGIGGFRR